MLLKMLKDAARSLAADRDAAPARPAASQAPAPTEYPLEIEEQLTRLHGRSPVDRHLEIQFQDVRVGGEPYAELFSRCLRDTGTAVTPFNVFHRYQTRLQLVQYLLAT